MLHACHVALAVRVVLVHKPTILAGYHPSHSHRSASQHCATLHLRVSPLFQKADRQKKRLSGAKSRLTIPMLRLHLWQSQLPGAFCRKALNSAVRTVHTARQNQLHALSVPLSRLKSAAASPLLLEIVSRQPCPVLSRPPAT